MTLRPACVLLLSLLLPAVSNGGEYRPPAPRVTPDLESLPPAANPAAPAPGLTPAIQRFQSKPSTPRDIGARTYQAPLSDRAPPPNLAITDEPYEPLSDSFEGPLPPRQDSDGRQLLRTPVLKGSYKDSVARLLKAVNYTPEWTGAPDCLDWEVSAPYVVQGPNLKVVLDRITQGYPVKVKVHEPNRVVQFKVEQLYRLNCK